MSSNRKQTSVLRASSSISIITLISRILGMVRDAVVARYFGAGLYTDAFYAAFKIPNLLRRLVAEGSLSTAFVPIFTEELQHSDQNAREAIKSATSFVVLLTVILTVLGVMFSSELTIFFAPGWEADSHKGQVAADLLQIMFPYLIIVSMTALTTSALNCLQVFAVPTFAQAILNIGMIVAALVSTSLFTIPIFGQAWGVIFGGILALLPQLIILKRMGFPVGFGSLTNSPALNRLITMMLPAIVSSSLYQFMSFINSVLASMLQEGSVSWLYYADRLFQFPLGVFTLAVAQAVLPTLSRLANANNERGFSHQLTKALNWITLICVPATVGLYLLAGPMTKVVYEGGTFSAEDSFQTAESLKAFAIGLWALSAQSILVRAFLAHKNANYPAIISSVMMVINIILAFLLMGIPTTQPSSGWGSFVYVLLTNFSIFSFGHVGLPLSGSITAFIALVWMSLSLHKIGVELEFAALFNCLAKSLIASVAMSILIIVMMKTILNIFLLLVAVIPASIAVYFVVLKLTHCNEINELLETLLKRSPAK